jgi:hypothetical protein
MMALEQTIKYPEQQCCHNAQRLTDIQINQSSKKPANHQPNPIQTNDSNQPSIKYDVIAQANSRWLPTVKTRVQSQSSPREICVGQNGTGASLYPRTWVYPRQLSRIIRGCYKAHLRSKYQETHSHPTSAIKTYHP